MENKKRQTAKVLLFAVMVTYFIGFIVGGILVLIYPEHLSDWLTYVGAAAVAAISWYNWKAKAENVVKLRKSLNEAEVDLRKDLEEVSSDPEAAYDEAKMSVDEILQELEDEAQL